VAARAPALSLTVTPEAAPAPLTLQAWRRFRRHRMALLGAAVLGSIAGVCAIAPLLVPESAANRVDPTLFRAPPSLGHPFGNDDVGRDILWRTIYGGRISLAIGALSIALAMTTGVVLGSVSG
jgi:peptide/nickel transport system permease protein